MFDKVFDFLLFYSKFMAAQHGVVQAGNSKEKHIT